MATKRTAKKQLTQDNWEEEDTKEEAGTFIKADTDAIGKRTIRKAIRRLHDTSVKEENNAGKSPFSNLNLTPKPFSFTNTESISATNGTTEKSSISDQNSIGTKCLNTNTTTNEKNSFRINPFVVNGQTTSNTSTSNSIVDSKKTKSEHSSEYYKNLAALNKSVSDWIKQHVDKNQYCILTPIFQDYEKYLKSIEESSPENSPETLKSTNRSSDDVTSEEEKKSTTATKSSTFAGFSFTNNKSFNFAASNLDSKVNKVSADTQEDEDAEYVPPIPEVNTIQEEGSVYSVKCKLFHKKDDSYIDKGVGTLHLILVDGMTQLLVRTDTTSGLILLNIRLTKSIPFNRLGKNNVSMLCMLNASDSKNEEQKPVSLLIRVKTAEAADELLSKLNEYIT